MPEPIDYQIVRALQASLVAIAMAAGYYFDVAGTAVKLDPNTDVESLLLPSGPRPFVILELLPDERTYFPAMQVLVLLNVRVHFVGESEPTEDESRLRTYLRACADIERAVASTMNAGGFVGCHDARIIGRTFDTAVDGSQVWAMNDVQFRYQRTFGTPESM